jgi:hypothetical protein
VHELPSSPFHSTRPFAKRDTAHTTSTPSCRGAITTAGVFTSGPATAGDS